MTAVARNSVSPLSVTAARADLVIGAVRPTVAAIAAPATWNMSLLVVAGAPLPSDIQGRGLGRLFHLRMDDEDGAGHTAVEVERTSAGTMNDDTYGRVSSGVDGCGRGSIVWFC